MVELKLDEWNLEQVAEVVKHFNPHARDVDIVGHMKWTAEVNLHEPGYVGTYGYMLTAYYGDDDDETLCIKASVDVSCFRGIDLCPEEIL